MIVTSQDIITGLRQLGLTSGSGVMVHSSLKSFGQVDGGAGTVIAALMEVITPSGALLMPSFNHDVPFREGGPGYYDPNETPTINGAIPDLFWRLPDVHRSLDPTHPIAAWGQNSRRVTQFHHRTLTMGPDSPLGLLCAGDGLGLLLGVDYSVNTFHHVVEMTTNAPCLGQRSEAYPVKLPDGRRVLGRTWGWRESNCPLTDAVRYQDEMASSGLHHQGMIGGCRATLFRLKDCFAVVGAMLRQGKAGFPPCHRCPVRPRRVTQTVPSDWDAEKQCLRSEAEAWSY
jgi:aminoglycoside 3-N-acetyltransferase